MPQTNETIFVTAELKIKTNIEREAAVEAINQHFGMLHTQAFIERDITELVQAFEDQKQEK